MASELESNLRDTVDWSRKWLVDFNAGKTQQVLFDQSNKTGAIDVKIGWSVLEEKSSFMILGLTFSSNLDWALTLSQLQSLPPRKLEPWFVLWSFFFLRLLCVSINLPYGYVWNTVIMSGLITSPSGCLCWSLSTSWKCSQLQSFL